LKTIVCVAAEADIDQCTVTRVPHAKELAMHDVFTKEFAE
jgi:hypothetical protein